MSARPGFRGEHRDSRFETRAEQRVDQLRVPPQSIEAEQAVLGGLMLAPDAYDMVGDSITERDFYRRDHQLIFRAIRELAEKNKPFDAVTLGEWFESMGESEQVAAPDLKPHRRPEGECGQQHGDRGAGRPRACSPSCGGGCDQVTHRQHDAHQREVVAVLERQFQRDDVAGDGVPHEEPRDAQREQRAVPAAQPCRHRQRRQQQEAGEG